MARAGESEPLESPGGQRTLYLAHDHATALAIHVSSAAFLDDLSHGNLVVLLDTLTADQTFVRRIVDLGVIGYGSCVIGGESDDGSE